MLRLCSIPSPGPTHPPRTTAPRSRPPGARPLRPGALPPEPIAFGLALVAWIGLLVTPAEGQVRLPETGRLAGTLDTTLSEFGDQFFNFPYYMEPTPPPGNTKMTGWIEIRFGEPEGNKAPFEVIYLGFGADPEFIEFGGGQEYFVGENRAFPASPNIGVLDLETGEVDSILMDTIFQNTLIAQTDKINRFFFAFPNSYPPPDIGIPVPPVPPGFFYADAEFRVDGSGRIVGFQFVGQSILPVGPAAQFNDIFGIFPLFSFGPAGEIYWPNPENCKPGTPDFACPNDEVQPEGVLLPDDSLFHPHLILLSDDLRPVPAERAPLPCAPEGLARGAVAGEIGGRLHVAGGLGEDGLASDRLRILDPSTGLLVDGPPMPRAVLDAQGGVIDSRLYVVGGRQRVDGPALADVQVFDPTTGAWSQVSDAPLTVARAGAAVVGDNLYLFGGLTNRPNGSPGGNLRLADHFQVFDATSDTWLAVPAVLNGRALYRDAPAAATVGGEIWVLGGLDLQGQPTDQVFVLDTITGRLRPGPPLRWGVHEAVADVAEGRVYLFGGRRQAEGPSDTGLQILETDRQAWLEGQGGPMPTAGAAGAMVGGELVVLGGRVQTGGDPAPGAATTTIQSFDPRRGWQICSSQPQVVSAGVMNTASLIVGLPYLAPGAQASIVGYNLGPPAFAPPAPTLPTELGGTRVLIDGQPAPLLVVVPNRIDLQVPDGVRTGVPVPVRVESAFASRPSPEVSVLVQPRSPGVFIQSCGVTHEPRFLDRSSAIACHADGSLNYFKNTVRPGERLFIQVNGLGATEPPVPAGQRAPDAPRAAAVDLPRVTVVGADGQPIEAQVLSATLAPGEAGIFDVEIVVPPGARIGNRVEVRVGYGDQLSNRAMISVGEFQADEPLPCQRDTHPIFRNCVPPILQTEPPLARPEMPFFVPTVRLPETPLSDSGL